MSEYTYDEAAIAVEQMHWDNTKAAYSRMITEEDESSAAFAVFKTPREQLFKQYSLDRQKAKFLFRKDPMTADRLQITGRMPATYIAKMEVIKKYYGVALVNVTIQTKLATMKVTLENLTATNTLITGVEAARTEYLREVGESQDATKTKDAALAVLDEWMQDFYSVARIALADKPQLLESLGVFVRS